MVYDYNMKNDRCPLKNLNLEYVFPLYFLSHGPHILGQNHSTRPDVHPILRTRNLDSYMHAVLSNANKNNTSISNIVFKYTTSGTDTINARVPLCSLNVNVFWIKRWLKDLSWLFILILIGKQGGNRVRNVWTFVYVLRGSISFSLFLPLNFIHFRLF